MRIAVIPARGGSKRIPRKNIKQFCGKPIIAWSIEAAIKSGCFDRIIVSTDDEEIAIISKEFGAEVPFLRPPELSGDHTPTTPVIAHAINWQNRHGYQTTEACWIFATAPFIQTSDIQRGLELLLSKDAEYAVSVTNYPFPIQRAIRVTSEQRIEMFQSKHFNTRSQDLEEAWHDAAHFNWGKASAWLAHKPLFSKDAVPVILPRKKVQDIDTPEDWEFAEAMFTVLNMEHSK